ncbi:hypothetical protein BDP55DRAFT_280796 [Colletotrichum godetiae]|uniref:Uncharacterized protein n=1 Tax=Colletotrichum godetiae TaxID=1209918 RepID=A0AAJ0AGK0_9PEZI|nr:uncharacterized protein BDP55DRAFT_280796 [Colletotrichum godetiae]KAK1671942.1 hypothetical protein BDP55DRAFT_280796 [Colletotrichum godetiae]
MPGRRSIILEGSKDDSRQRICIISAANSTVPSHLVLMTISSHEALGLQPVQAAGRRYAAESLFCSSSCVFAGTSDCGPSLSRGRLNLTIRREPEPCHDEGGRRGAGGGAPSVVPSGAQVTASTEARARTNRHDPYSLGIFYPQQANKVAKGLERRVKATLYHTCHDSCKSIDSGGQSTSSPEQMGHTVAGLHHSALFIFTLLSS